MSSRSGGRAARPRTSRARPLPPRSARSQASCSILRDLRANDAFERVKHRAGPNALDRIGPVRSLAQVDRVVIAVGEPESNRHASGRLESQRVDQLLPQKSHRRRAENDDTLLVQPDDPLIRPEIEQFCEVQVRCGQACRRDVVAASRCAILRSRRRSDVDSGVHRRPCVH